MPTYTFVSKSQILGSVYSGSNSQLAPEVVGSVTNHNKIAFNHDGVIEWMNLSNIDSLTNYVYIDEIVFVNSALDLPITGNVEKLYIIKSTNSILRWDGGAYINMLGSEQTRLTSVENRMTAAEGVNTSQTATIGTHTTQISTLTTRTAPIDTVAGVPANSVLRSGATGLETLTWKPLADFLTSDVLIPLDARVVILETFASDQLPINLDLTTRLATAENDIDAVEVRATDLEAFDIYQTGRSDAHDTQIATLEAQIPPTLTGLPADSICYYNSTTSQLEYVQQIPSSVLPSYVDDVLEYTNFAALPGTGETGKIYVTLDNNNTYRWTGTVYIQLNTADVGTLDTRTTALETKTVNMTTFPDQTGQVNKVLSTTGTSLQWVLAGGGGSAPHSGMRASSAEQLMLEVGVAHRGTISYNNTTLVTLFTSANSTAVDVYCMPVWYNILLPTWDPTTYGFSVKVTALGEATTVEHLTLSLVNPLGLNAGGSAGWYNSFVNQLGVYYAVGASVTQMFVDGTSGNYGLTMQNPANTNLYVGDIYTFIWQKGYLWCYIHNSSGQLRNQFRSDWCWLNGQMPAKRDLLTTVWCPGIWCHKRSMQVQVLNYTNFPDFSFLQGLHSDITPPIVNVFK